jgi:hypothetical protein
MIFAFEFWNLTMEPRLHPEPFDNLRMNIKNEIAQNPYTDFDIIALGDCFNLEGFDPVIVEHITGLKTFNFASHSDHSIFSSYLMLHNYLESGARPPRYIVINFIPEVTVFGEQSFKRRTLPYLYDLRFGNFDEFIDEIGFYDSIRYLIPSLKHKDFFATLLNSDHKPIAKPERVAEFKQSVFDEQGHYRNYNENVYTDHVGPSPELYRFYPSPFFDHHLRNILDLAKTHKIQVLFPMFTAPPDWYENLYERSKMITIYFHYLKQLKEEYAHLHFFSMQDQLNEKRFYRDTVHLNKWGSKIYSQRLGQLIVWFEKKGTGSNRLLTVN